MLGRLGIALATALGLLLGPTLAGAADATGEGPGWGVDVALLYGYFDRDGRLESAAPGRSPGSDPLQLDGTIAGLRGRVRLPLEAWGGRPFLQVSGEFDASDAQDGGGLSLGAGTSDFSFVEISYQAGLAATAGIEWETAPIRGERPLRIRPYGGLALAFWDAHLDNDRGVASAFVDRDNEDFATGSGRLGLELGLPLWAGRRSAVDVLLGGRLDLPLGDSEQDFEVIGSGGSRVHADIEIDEGWAAYTGLEWRWSAAPR